MASEWFCEISGRQLGPLSSQQLRAMAEQGRLMPEHRVRQGAEGPWVPAARVKGLFQGDATPAPPRPVKPVDPSAASPSETPKARPTTSKAVRVAKTPPSPPPPPPAATTEPSGQPPGISPGHEEFSIVTEAGTPWERVAGRGGAGPSGRKKPLLMAGLLVLLVLGLSAAGIAVYLGNRPDEAAAVAEPEPSADALPASPEEKNWVDASDSAIQCGEVRVSILEAKQGYPRFASRLPAPDALEEYLLLTVKLENLAESKKLEYESWGSRSSLIRRVRLTDNVRNTYRSKSFGRAELEGQVGAASIYPGETVEDLLVFERPVETAEYLQLELPAAAFGQPGALYFTIPREMIKVTEEEPEPSLPAMNGDTGGPIDDGAIERGIEALQRETEREPAEDPFDLGEDSRDALQEPDRDAEAEPEAEPFGEGDKDAGNEEQGEGVMGDQKGFDPF